MSDALQEEKTLQQPDTQQQGIESQISMDRPIPVLIIQSHPDLIRVGDIARLEALLDNQVIDLARGKLDFCRGNSVLGKPLADPYLSRSAINIKMLANDELVFDCSDSKTTLTVGETVVDSSITLSTAQMATGVVITLGERVTLLLKSQLLKSQLSKSSLSTHRPMSSDFNMVGVSAKLMEVKQQLASLRGVDECVMITGATGVGKELVAQAIYDVSNRVGAPFVKVSLGSISSALAAAELFGASKGAYTGADKNRNGYFAAAQGGTLFLDEIGEASIELQSMLLRVLESGEYYPVGSSKPQKSNVRLITATDADLPQLCEQGHFKRPLLYRLNGYEISVPTLADKKEDIGLLFLYFAKQTLQQLGRDWPSKTDAATPWISTRLMQLLLDYDWPGNIRQLKNVTTALVIDSKNASQLKPSEKLIEQLTPTKLAPATLTSKQPVDVINVSNRKPNTIAYEELKQALVDNRWEIQSTAQQLNISRPSIYELLRKYQIMTASDFSDDDIYAAYVRHDKNVADMAMELQVSVRALARRIKKCKPLAEL